MDIENHAKCFEYVAMYLDLEGEKKTQRVKRVFTHIHMGLMLSPVQGEYHIPTLQ